jgi:CheY-like chemotaxis protein
VAAGHTLKVLIVDDDDADTLMIEEALQAVANPPEIARVADGQEAVDYLGRHEPYTEAARPDLILLDLNMPRISGHDVLSEVKNDPDLQSIPAVVLTTSDTDGDVLASYTRHANAFVTKPLDLHPFKTAVQQISRLFTHTSGAHLRGSERYARLQATL